MNTIYTGSFASVDGVHYRVDIQSSTAEVGTPGELVFAYETPVEIEWTETDKIEPVQSSSMTLTLVSEKDRQYIDLYTIEPGTIRANVYREGKLYWSGMLDPELYEEPYSWKENYEVEFIFSDFAILDRRDWTERGIGTMKDIFLKCIEGTGIDYQEIVDHISLLNSQTLLPVDFSEIYLLQDNFFDEDDEPMTQREVLEAILQPFALRIVQKNGRLYVYDLNDIYNNLSTEEVWWKSDDAVLGADTVYNNVKITFSPYADTELVSGSIDHDDVLPNKTGQLWKMDNDWDNAADGFHLVVGDQDDLGLELNNGAKYFRIDTEYSGNDEAGVIYAYKGNAKGNYDNILLNDFPRVHYNDSYHSAPIITCKSAFLGHVYLSSHYNLKIELSTLFDVRYNPFESASNPNEEGNWERLNDWSNFGYIPCMLRLKDKDGNVLYHYHNSTVMVSSHYRHDACKWVEGDGHWGTMYLCYYDRNNRKSSCGFGGWQKNKPIIGYYRKGLPKKWESLGDGEFIELPPVGGWLELQIGMGVHQFDYKREEKDIWSRARWLAYKEPTITLVNKNGTDLDQNDVEDNAWINKSAEEDYELDTTVGTLDTAYNASARGIVMDADYAAIRSFCRAYHHDRLERLLIGTIYSQYAERKTTLSGTIRILPEMHVLTDESTEGKFILLSEVQDLMQDESEIKMVQFEPDNYTGIEDK